MKKLLTILCVLSLFWGMGTNALAWHGGGHHHGYHKGGGYHHKGYHNKGWNHKGWNRGTPRGWHRGNNTGWRGQGMPSGQF